MIRQRKLKITEVTKLRWNSFTSLTAVLIFSVGCSAEEYTDGRGLSALDSQPQSILVEHCGNCHVAPKPQTKAAKDWLAVVLRMQVHRSQQAMPVLTEPQINEVTEYLMKHSQEQ